MLIKEPGYQIRSRLEKLAEVWKNVLHHNNSYMVTPEEKQIAGLTTRNLKCEDKSSGKYVIVRTHLQLLGQIQQIKYCLQLHVVCVIFRKEVYYTYTDRISDILLTYLGLCGLVQQYLKKVRQHSITIKS